MGDSCITRRWKELMWETILCYLKNAVNWFIDLIHDILLFFVNFLPPSPFQWARAEEFNNLFAYINYFIPISGMITILGGYVVAVATYYLASWALRMVRLIGQ